MLNLFQAMWQPPHPNPFWGFMGAVSLIPSHIIDGLVMAKMHPAAMHHCERGYFWLTPS